MTTRGKKITSGWKEGLTRGGKKERKKVRGRKNKEKRKKVRGKENMERRKKEEEKIWKEDEKRGRGGEIGKKEDREGE